MMTLLGIGLLLYVVFVAATWADTYWIGGVSTDMTNAANWNAIVPIIGSNVFILNSAQNMTSCIDDSGDLAYGTFKIGSMMTGEIGTAANPWFMGSNTGIFEVDAPSCPAAYFAVGTGKTVPQVSIKRNSGTANSTVISGPGIITNLNVGPGCYVRITANAVIVRLEVTGGMVEIASGATITTAVISGGYVQNDAAVANITVSGGTWNHKGATTYDISGTLLVCGGTFLFASKGGTVALGVLQSGTLDCNVGDGTPRTFTLFRQAGGNLNKSGLGSTVVFPASAVYAGGAIAA